MPLESEYESDNDDKKILQALNMDILACNVDLGRAIDGDKLDVWLKCFDDHDVFAYINITEQDALIQLQFDETNSDIADGTWCISTPLPIRRQTNKEKSNIKFHLL